MNLIKAIKDRHSVRTFRPGGIEAGHVDQLKAWIAKSEAAPFSTPLRFHLLDKTEMGEQKIGTYGTIRGAEYYLAGAVAENAPMGLEDFGFLMEGLMLKLTALGLGSCWLGAAFRRGQIVDLIGLEEGYIIPALTPVGVAAEKPRLREAITLKLMKARQRKGADELFFDGSPGHPLMLTDEIRLPFELVRIAPSAINRQPWRIVKSGECHHFYRNTEKKVLSGGVDLQRIDMGIAMCHFDIGARELGWSGHWSRENPGLVDLPDGMAYCFTYCR